MARHPHYGRVAQVMQSQTFNGTVTKTGRSIPIPLEAELRKHYGSDFKTIVMASWDYNHVLAAGEKKIDQSGSFMQPDAPELFGLTMIAGSKGALADRTAIVLSEHVARALFGNVGIALVIALPLAGYFMLNWLQHYTYQTDLPWWVFTEQELGELEPVGSGEQD